MSYYIGIDLGTSSLKALLTDNYGNIINEVVREYNVYYPNPTWSEQHPSDWWNALISGVKELVCGYDASSIKALGIGGQMHGLVALDESDNVIRPAILWNDARTSAETEYLNKVIGKSKLSELTANIAYAGFTAPKILWMKNNEPENFMRLKKIMLPKDYLNYRITGVHSTDYSDASGMLLLDVKNKCWSSEMLQICGISDDIMPKLYESYEVIGKILPNIAEELGLTKDTVIVAGAGDNAAAAISTATVANGKCNISLGTSGTVFISSDTFSVDENNSLHSFCHSNGKFHLMACILSAASCNKWFSSDILNIKDYDDLQKNITDKMLGNNDVYFLPYLMGERSPINDTDARGTFTGIRIDTTRYDMLQAVLEGVAFAIKDNIEIAKELGIKIESSSICGGGAKSELWKKIMCNVLNIPLYTQKTEQGPSYGAAMLAMVGAGEYNSVQECCEKLIKTESSIYPDKDISERYKKKYEKFKVIYPQMKNIFKALKEN